MGDDRDYDLIPDAHTARYCRAFWKVDGGGTKSVAISSSRRHPVAWAFCGADPHESWERLCLSCVGGHAARL